MIKALLIDDEPSALETLSLMIRRYVPDITGIQLCNDPVKAIGLIRDWKPALVFLDIQMPAFTGFEMLKRISDIDFEVIFTTAYDQYAVEAIRFSALDFLLKPIDADELKAAVERFKERLNTSGQRQQFYQNLRYNMEAGRDDQKLAITNTQGTFFYRIGGISRVEGEGNYSRLYFDTGNTVLASKTLKDFEEMLSSHGFVRVHKSHLVNKRFVVSVLNDNTVKMEDGSILEISRRRKEAVMEALK